MNYFTLKLAKMIPDRVWFEPIWPYSPCLLDGLPQLKLTSIWFLKSEMFVRFNILCHLKIWKYDLKYKNLNTIKVLYLTKCYNSNHSLKSCTVLSKTIKMYRSSKLLKLYITQNKQCLIHMFHFLPSSTSNPSSTTCIETSTRNKTVSLQLKIETSIWFEIFNLDSNDPPCLNGIGLIYCMSITNID